jgi:hypothetical protein
MKNEEIENVIINIAYSRNFHSVDHNNEEGMNKYLHYMYPHSDMDLGYRDL